TQRVNSALFTPDGSRLLTAGDDGVVCVCNAATGALVQKLDHRADAAAVVALALTPDGQRVVTIGEPVAENDPFVICDWVLNTAQLARKTRFAPGLSVFGMAVSPVA